jgi:hypothetical protein
MYVDYLKETGLYADDSDTVKQTKYNLFNLIYNDSEKFNLQDIKKEINQIKNGTTLLSKSNTQDFLTYLEENFMLDKSETYTTFNTKVELKGKHKVYFLLLNQYPYSYKKEWGEPKYTFVKPELFNQQKEYYTIEKLETENFERYNNNKLVEELSKEQEKTEEFSSSIDTSENNAYKKLFDEYTQSIENRKEAIEAFKTALDNLEEIKKTIRESTKAIEDQEKKNEQIQLQKEESIVKNLLEANQRVTDAEQIFQLKKKEAEDATQKLKEAEAEAEAEAKLVADEAAAKEDAKLKEALEISKAEAEAKAAVEAQPEPVEELAQPNPTNTASTDLLNTIVGPQIASTDLLNTIAGPQPKPEPVLLQDQEQKINATKLIHEALKLEKFLKEVNEWTHSDRD